QNLARQGDVHPRRLPTTYPRRSCASASDVPPSCRRGACPGDSSEYATSQSTDPSWRTRAGLLKNAKDTKSSWNFSWLRRVLQAAILKFSMRTAGGEPLQQSCSTTGLAHHWTTGCRSLLDSPAPRARIIVARKTRSQFLCCPVMGTVTRTSDYVVAEERP